MKVTIQAFQALNEIADSPLSDLQKSIEFVKVLTNKTDFEVETMSSRKFNRICNFINKKMQKWNDKTLEGKPKKIIVVKGKAYKLNYDILQVNAGRYVEVMEFSKENAVANLHKILASIVTPLKLTLRGYKELPYKAEDHERIANEMLHADYDDVFHALVFFYAVLKMSIENMSTYGKSPQEMIAVQLLRRSLNYLDGFTKPNWYRSLTELN